MNNDIKALSDAELEQISAGAYSRPGMGNTIEFHMDNGKVLLKNTATNLIKIFDSDEEYENWLGTQDSYDFCH